MPGSAVRRIAGMTDAPLTLITGASSGIGKALARRLASDGHRLLLLARRAERLETLAAQITAEHGAQAHAVPVDLSDPEATAAACARVLEEHGAPDIIVNNAGSGAFRAIEETSPAEARAQMALPYFAAFDVTRAFIEPMLERGSGIVFQVNSPVAVIPWPGAVGYAAARYALRGFTEALRQDLHGTGIRVGSLTPTRVHSEYFTANPESVQRVPKAEILVGTMTPRQVADAIAEALAERPGRDSFAPRRWSVVAPIARAVQPPFTWLFRVTGHRRSRRRSRMRG